MCLCYKVQNNFKINMQKNIRSIHNVHNMSYDFKIIVQMLY